MRVLVLRTSRFAPLAILGARNRWPGAELRVVYQPGAETELRAAGVAPEPSLRMRRGGRVTLPGLLLSRWGWQVLRWRPNQIVVQWRQADGDGHGGIDPVLALLRPQACHAVLASSTWMLIQPWHRMGRRTVTCWYVVRGTLLVSGVVLATALTWPAAVFFRVRARGRA